MSIWLAEGVGSRRVPLQADSHTADTTDILFWFYRTEQARKTLALAGRSMTIFRLPADVDNLISGRSNRVILAYVYNFEVQGSSKPMPTLFLHMGAGKTGTSALQVAFAQNAEQLLKSGILYPTGSNNSAAEGGRITSGNGTELAKYLNPDLKIPKNFNLNTATRNFEKALKSAKNVLYSSEFFWSFKPDLLKGLIERSAKMGYETKIVYYIRSIAGHAASVYSQTIKRQKSESSFQEFLIKRYKNPFLSTIERANETVGIENLLVYNFDALRENLFIHFLQKILAIDTESADFIFPKNVNRSLNAFEVEFMRYLNARLEDPYQATFVSDALIYADAEVRPDFTITPSEMSLLQSQFGAVVDKLNDYVIGEKVTLCDSSVVVGERPQVQLNDFERSVLSVLARLIPTSPRTEGFALRTLKRLRRISQ